MFYISNNNRNILLSSLFLLISANSFASGGNAGSTPYFEIDTPFVVNLVDDKGVAYLQVHAQFLVEKPELKAHLHAHLPGIKHTIMMVLSESSVAEVKTLQGKQALREKAVKETQAFLQEQIGDPVIQDILFTSFVVQ